MDNPHNPFLDIDDDAPLTHPKGEPRPAATLVLLSEREQGPPEVLMLERSAKMDFIGGAVVFPGGAVDPQDKELAQRFAPEGIGKSDAAARIAAIRETIEEVGIAVGFQQICDVGQTAEMRAGLLEGANFGEIVERFKLSFDLRKLTPMARWLPPEFSPFRIYDTRFYVARADASVAHACADGSEAVSLVHAGAAEYLEMAARGEVELIFPTRRTLERIAQFDSYAAFIEHVHQHPIRVIQPQPFVQDGVTHMTIPEGLGYPRTRAPMQE